MQQLPRPTGGTLFTKKEMVISIIQGVVIAAGALFLYYFFMNRGDSIQQTRTIVFTYLILGNLFLTFVNRSFTKTIYYTRKYKNSLAPIIIIVSAVFLAGLYFIPFARQLFQLTTISMMDLLLCFSVSFVSVVWFEGYKYVMQKYKTV